MTSTRVGEEVQHQKLSLSPQEDQLVQPLGKRPCYYLEKLNMCIPFLCQEYAQEKLFHQVMYLKIFYHITHNHNTNNSCKVTNKRMLTCHINILVEAIEIHEPLLFHSTISVYQKKPVKGELCKENKAIIYTVLHLSIVYNVN